ncbi:N-6 DNA methylase, partial [bacterium]|nr:N-6 DNA methylase [bacterium]
MPKKTMTKKELRKLWEIEREGYKEQEVGTGVQTFIKHVLDSEEIFNLKEGKLKTKLVERENEYIYEKRTKQGRRADFAIFINPEIIIPIEVERYENIEAGIEQIANYQKDLDKKYGILTDGYTWRFYNNNKFIVWNLDDILSKERRFEDFWTDYIRPRNYYLSFFMREEDFQGEESLSVDENRERFFDDITHLIRSLRNRLEIKHYFNGIDEKEKEKRATETSYAYVIQFILYKALVDNEFSDFNENFKRRIEHIGKALDNKSYKEALNYIIGVSDRISEDIYKPFNKEQKLINERIRKILSSLESTLSDIMPWLDIFVFIKKYNFANIQNEIFGFVYENYLKELFEEKQKGQYFTDPAVVNFMLQQVGYTSEYIKEKVENGELDKLSIIDPACGSGTFLYKAVDEIINSFRDQSEQTSEKIEEIVTNNVFGLDIAEFPLYLAEMSILMRMLPYIVGEKYNNPVDKKIKVFWTKDSISEFIFDNITNTEIDEETGVFQRGLFDNIVKPKTPSFIRDDEDLDEMKKSMQIPRRRFDFVVANPPYVGYNQCSKQGLLINKLIQGKKVKMSNIYGVNLNTVPGHLKAYAPKPNLYAFFVALGVSLLKEKDRLCFIIPQTILTSTDLDVLRYHLS